MAINKVVAPNSVPTNVSDYVAQNAHMMGFMTQVNMQAFVLTDPTTADKPKIALGSYIAHGGSLYKVESGDETISGSPADGKVYVRVTGNATLSASFISDISGYSYNHAYGTMTSGAYTLLPYVVIKVGTSWLKYRYDAVQKLQAETLNTGQGDNLLYPMNQAVRTTDSPTFASINTGHGANELYAMNQNVRTTDAVTFATVNTGFGANEIYRITTSGSYYSKTLPPMIIGEIMFYRIDADLIGDYAYIKAPEEGSFINIFVPFGHAYGQAQGGLINGGDTIALALSEGGTLKGAGVIRRVG